MKVGEIEICERRLKSEKEESNQLTGVVKVFVCEALGQSTAIKTNFIFSNKRIIEATTSGQQSKKTSTGYGPKSTLDVLLPIACYVNIMTWKMSVCNEWWQQRHYLRIIRPNPRDRTMDFENYTSVFQRYAHNTIYTIYKHNLHVHHVDKNTRG